MNCFNWCNYSLGIAFPDFLVLYVVWYLGIRGLLKSSKLLLAWEKVCCLNFTFSSSSENQTRKTEPFILDKRKKKKKVNSILLFFINQGILCKFRDNGTGKMWASFWVLCHETPWDVAQELWAKHVNPNNLWCITRWQISHATSIQTFSSMFTYSDLIIALRGRRIDN